ncbi:MAG: MauE/DoxX family redox-associated membrane protein [Actinomycetota bacterium]
MTDLQVFSATTMSVVLGVAAWGKLRAPANFRRALASYKVIPNALFPALVLGVPVAEVTFGALQWVPALQPLVGIGMALMFVTFTLLLLRSLVAGEDADCGCFGSAAPEKVSWFSIVRNVVLIAIALVGAFATDGAADARIAAGLTGVGAALIVLIADQGFALFSKHWYRADGLGG